ncbi:MAG: septum formation initiator family protein [Candidatus Kapaibacterium sp.]|nr:MAG: septum formation initiator family protein [Candidatus Kapabacteria bacterium]
MTDQKKRRLMLGMLIGVPLAAYTLFSSRGLFSRVSLEWEQRSLKERVEAATKEQDSLKAVIHQLETDTVMIERIAREKYGMIRDGERVFIVNEQPSLKK